MVRHTRRARVGVVVRVVVAVVVGVVVTVVVGVVVGVDVAVVVGVVVGLVRTHPSKLPTRYASNSRLMYAAVSSHCAVVASVRVNTPGVMSHTTFGVCWLRLNSLMRVLKGLASPTPLQPRADASYRPVMELQDMVGVLTVEQSFIMRSYCAICATQIALLPKTSCPLAPQKTSPCSGVVVGVVVRVVVGVVVDVVVGVVVADVVGVVVTVVVRVVVGVDVAVVVGVVVVGVVVGVVVDDVVAVDVCVVVGVDIVQSSKLPSSNALTASLRSVTAASQATKDSTSGAPASTPPGRHVKVPARVLRVNARTMSFSTTAPRLQSVSFRFRAVMATRVSPAEFWHTNGKSETMQPTHMFWSCPMRY
jgi:hypothetical protein